MDNIPDYERFISILAEIVLEVLSKEETLPKACSQETANITDKRNT